MPALTVISHIVDVHFMAHYAWRAFQTSFSCGIVHRWPLSRTEQPGRAACGRGAVDALQLALALNLARSSAQCARKSTTFDR